MKTIVAFVPLLALVLGWLLLTAHRQAIGLAKLSTRGTFVVAFVGFEALVVISTEAASRGHDLTGRVLVVFWIVVVALLGVGLAVTLRSETARRRLAPDRVRTWFVHRRPGELLAIGFLVSIVSLLAVIGWLYWPNNADSLVYHLPRVAQWVQQRSVEYFPTHYTAQIEMSPLHEFNMLHLHLLTGTDRLDGYPQLLAFVVCCVGAAEIVRLLGGGASAQLGAAALTAIIPSAVLEATSTQNNLFAAAVGVAIVVLLLAWDPAARTAGVALALGCAGGVAVVVKGILPPLIGVVVAILVVRVVVSSVRHDGAVPAARRLAVSSLVVVVGVVVLAGPFLQRNRELFGTFAGPVSSGTINSAHSVRQSAGNLLRSVAVNFWFGDDHSGLETVAQRGVLGLTGAAYDGLGIDNNDRRFVIGTTVDPFVRGDYRPYSRTEEYGANGWFLLLSVVASVMLVVGWRRGDRNAGLAALLMGGCALGFVVFAASAKWSVYVPRYHLPVLVLAAALSAFALSRLGSKVVVAAAVALTVAALPQLIDNSARSLVNLRHDYPNFVSHYFTREATASSAAGFQAAIDSIAASGCRELGIANWILLEYPIWAGLEHEHWEGTIHHVDVDNESARLEDPQFTPCALVFEPARGGSPTLPTGWTEEAHEVLTVMLAPT